MDENLREKHWNGTKNKAIEKWIPVVGYEGWYSVSSFGRIRRDRPAPRTRVGRILTQWVGKKGYLFTVLCKNNVAKSLQVHSIVCRAFIGEKKSGITVNHIDGKKTNNNILNLEYCTYSENGLHAYRTGLKMGCLGEHNGMSKITKDDVEIIKHMYKVNMWSQSKIAREYKLSQSHIGRIIRGERWK